MKHLFASLLTVVCCATYAQFPSIPYNPDENGDGLIGVVDLQGLLANYGSTFEGAILSSDGNTAVVEVGSMNFLTCKLTCAALPGVWDIIDENSAGLILPGLTSITWLDIKSHNYNSGSTGGSVLAYHISSDDGEVSTSSGSAWDNSRKCFCAAQQRPRVEWSYCEHSGNNYNDALPSNIQECYNQKLEEGWYPLGGPSVGQLSISQSFWRWAE